MTDKKGFFAVYACMFLTVILAAAGIFIGGAKKSAVIATAEACSRLWSQSILAEYDLNLQRRYHLFGYYGYRAMVQDKLTFYAKESYGGKDGNSLQIMSCSLDEHSLRNPEVFKEQIIRCGKVSMIDTFQEPEQEIQGVTHHEKPGTEVLFADLPSAGCKTGIHLPKLPENFSVQELTKEGSDAYFLLRYIFSHFKHQCNSKNLGETCLQSEIEYIIGGKNSDEANEKAVKRRIIPLREVVNIAFLEKDPAKSAEVHAAAALLAPEAAEVTAQAMMAAWAYAESVNDYRLLVEGHVVPKIKTAETWATDLESVLQEDGTSACIDTGNRKGDDYEDYLQLLLLTMDENCRLLRMMDLIQMNMRYSYYDAFSIGDYYGGISYTYNIQGETCHVEETYE